MFGLDKLPRQAPRNIQDKIPRIHRIYLSFKHSVYTYKRYICHFLPLYHSYCGSSMYHAYGTVVRDSSEWKIGD